jgi:hypothetical protein
MTDTVNLGLPCIDAGQAQKHVTHNEALQLLDSLVQLAVLDRDLTAPPLSPSEGQRWIVKNTSPSGAWSGHGNQIAAWRDDGWQFIVPKAGWFAYVVDEGALLAWSGSAWVDAITGITALNNLTLLGLGAIADATNPFSAKLNNALWTAKTVAEGGDGTLRWKMSKESAADTLSMLFQDNFSGRAEIGLIGDDDFHVKVSGDGSTWLDALVIDRATGKLSLAQGFGDQAVARAQLAAAPYGALAYNNVVVNAAIDVSQELGDSGATLVSGAAKYVADCFEAQYAHSTAVVTGAQVASGSFPSPLAGFQFGHQVKATTAIASPANGDYARHRTKIEGYRIAHWAWGTLDASAIAVAFRLYSTAAGTAFVKLSNSDQSRCYYHETAVAAGWNFYAFTVLGDTGGAWQATTSTGLTFELFVAGKETTPQSTLDAWGTGNKVQTTNSTNLLGTNNNLTILTGLFIAAGTQLPVAGDLPRLMRPFDHELRLAQRYWSKNVGYDNKPGNTGGSGGEAPRYAMFSWAGTSLDSQRIFFPVTMRITPTLAFYSANIPGASNGNWQIYDGVSTWQTGTSISAQSHNDSGFVAEVAGFTVTTKAAYIGYGGFTADARL